MFYYQTHKELIPMKKHIKTILSLVLAVALVGGVVISNVNNQSTNEPTPNDYPHPRYACSYAGWVVREYRSSMLTYDLVMTGKSNSKRPMFLDPHEAWESYINRPIDEFTGRPVTGTDTDNNWFHWLDTHWGTVDEAFAETQEPNNFYPESPEWWARMDSYMELVHPNGHTIDNDLTGEEDWRDYELDFSDMDRFWIEWYDINVDGPKVVTFGYWTVPGYTPYQGMSFKEWVEMRENMSADEDTLFREWFNEGKGMEYFSEVGSGVTFDEYKERKGFTDNQPTQPSTVPVPTVTPTPTKNPDVVVPDGVTEITGGTCHLHDYHPYINPLNSVTIPTSVTKIYHHAFVMCHPKDIYYAGTKEQWDAIEMVYVMDEVNTLEGTTIHFSDGSTSNPAPTPSAAPTVTPEPTPTATPAPVETQPVQHFADVTPDAWYYEAVNNMAEAGILKGKGDGQFHPNDNITNGEVATIICRIGQSASERYVAFGDPNSKYYSPDAINNMTHWAERAIAASVASTNGTGAGTFYASVETADNACSRRSVFEAMAMLAYEDQFPQYWHPEYLYDGQVQADGRIYYVKKLDVTYEEQMAAKSEIHDIRDTDFGTMTCWVLGIIHGDGNGYVHPDAGITRAELCQILYNMGAKTCYLDL